MTESDLQKLPPPERKVACNVLRRLGFSYGQIGQIVGVPRTTAFDYAQLEVPTDPDLERFRTELEAAFSDYEVILAAKAAARIDETIARAKISEALEVYKTMRGKERVGNQVNVGVVLPSWFDDGRKKDGGTSS